MDPCVEVHCPLGEVDCPLAEMVQEEIVRAATGLPEVYRKRKTRAFSDYGQPLEPGATEVDR